MRPMLPVLGFYGTGLVVARFWQPPWAVLLLAAYPVLAAALLSARLRPWLLPILLALSGWANVTLRTAIVSPHDLRLRAAEMPAIVNVRGRLVHSPTLHTWERDGENRHRSLALVDISAWRSDGAWNPAHGRIMVSTPGTLPEPYHAGRTVEIGGVLDVPPGPSAIGSFDYRKYLADRSVYFLMKCQSTGDWRIIDQAQPSAAPLPDRFNRWARATLALGFPTDDQAIGLLQAMTLGWKTALNGEIEQSFMRSGTMHIFAISGLHVALVAGILMAILRLVRLPRTACGLITIALLWFYTAATGWQPSAIRASLMMSVILGGWILRRPSNLLNSLAVAAFIILLFDPLQLFQASFQLSFCVVLCLAVLLPPLNEQVRAWLQPDPMLPRELVPRWKRWLGVPLRYVLLLGATSLAAWLGSMPLTASYFNLFNPMTVLANVLIVPLASLTLASAMASLAGALVSPWLSEVFNHGAWFWMKLMMLVSDLTSSIPGTCSHVAAPPVAALLLYYGLILACGAGWITRQRASVVLPAAAATLVVLLGWHVWSLNHQNTVTVLPMNGSSAVLVQNSRYPHQFLIDCGNTNAFQFSLEPLLNVRGIDHIDALALSHGDMRAVGAAPLLWAEFSPKSILTSPIEFRSRAYRKIVESIETRLKLRKLVSAGESVGDWEVLYPPNTNRVQRADDGALVLRGNLRGTRVMLLSELGRAGQRDLMERQADLGADILVAGLPEREEPVYDDLLRRIDPDLIIVADSTFPATRRAPARLLRRLEGTSHAEVLSTRKEGVVVLEFNPQGWRALGPEGTVLATGPAPQTPPVQENSVATSSVGDAASVEEAPATSAHRTKGNRPKGR